ncbi:MAG: PRC-barrel domain protein [Betaproteobacteria bacterium]|jgi:sporulation protein YlmC with PRC-barrel domain|nr:PRC-barrel domain protein [Betaproteobacteria bacterium]
MPIKQCLAAAALCMPLLAGTAHAQVAGSTSLGVANLTMVANGWSVKKKVLNKVVYNEDNKRIGKISDIIVAPDGTASFFIIGAGGFLGVARHDVAIPVGQISEDNGKFILTGATKEALKGMPKFDYAK